MFYFIVLLPQITTIAFFHLLIINLYNLILFSWKILRNFLPSKEIEISNRSNDQIVALFFFLFALLRFQTGLFPHMNKPINRESDREVTNTPKDANKAK